MHKLKVCDVAFSVWFHTQHCLSVPNTLTIQDISFHLSALRRGWFTIPIHINMDDLISSQSLLLAGCSLQISGFQLTPDLTNCADIRFGGQYALLRGGPYLRSLVLRAYVVPSRIELLFRE